MRANCHGKILVQWFTNGFRGALAVDKLTSSNGASKGTLFCSCGTPNSVNLPIQDGVHTTHLSISGKSLGMVCDFDFAMYGTNHLHWPNLEIVIYSGLTTNMSPLVTYNRVPPSEKSVEKTAASSIYLPETQQWKMSDMFPSLANSS